MKALVHRFRTLSVVSAVLLGTSVAHAQSGTVAFAEGRGNDGTSSHTGSRTDVNPAAQSSAAANHNGASSAASADLSSGKLAIYAASSANSQAEAHAVFRDTLTFTIAGANAQTVTPIDVSWLVHGGFTPVGVPGGNGWLIGELQFGGAVANDMDYQGFSNPDARTSSGFSSASWTLTEADTYRFDGIFNLVGASQSVSLQARMTAYTYGSVIGDFGNTASLRLRLPSQVSYTSESGAFLTAESAVPESSTWAILVVGFGAVGGMLRIRKRAEVTAFA